MLVYGAEDLSERQVKESLSTTVTSTSGAWCYGGIMKSQFQGLGSGASRSVVALPRSKGTRRR